MARALFCTVGGSVEPIVKCVQRYLPEYVCFVASQESVREIGRIQDALDNAGTFPVESSTCVLGDPDDLVGCYARIITAIEAVFDKGFSSEDIIIDFTGGRKTMSVAAGIAGIEKKCRFSYVSGAERNKGGLGTVISGSEIITTHFNPWQVFAVDERKLVSNLFNSYRFTSDGMIIDSLLQGQIIPQYKSLFEIIQVIVKGYEAWERFEHAKAVEYLKNGAQTLSDALRLTRDDSLSKFCECAKGNLEFLQRMQQNTRGFKELHEDMVTDVISNAERRAEEHKFDDAVARLYRAVEMTGQLEFEREFKMKTEAVEEVRLPAEARKALREKIPHPPKTTEIGMQTTFHVLNAVGNEKAGLFMAKREAFRAIQYSRNHSILAHGVNPVSGKTFKEFDSFIRETFSIDEKVEFPKLML